MYNIYIMCYNRKRERERVFYKWKHFCFCVFGFFSVNERDQNFLLSVLNIPEVTEEYLYTNLTCLVQHPAGSDLRKVILIPGVL